MAEDCRNPSPKLRAAAKVLHNISVLHGWAGPHYKKTYEELEKTDPIGFEEFNAIVANVIDAAEKAAMPS